MKVVFYKVEFEDDSSPEAIGQFFVRTLKEARQCFIDNATPESTYRLGINRVTIEGRTVVDIAMAAAHACTICKNPVMLRLSWMTSSRPPSPQLEKTMPTEPSREWLQKMADAEDAIIGGLTAGDMLAAERGLPYLLCECMGGEKQVPKPARLPPGRKGSRMPPDTQAWLAEQATWVPVDSRLPQDGIVVETKIDDEQGTRNEQDLKRQGRLWFFPDGSMYVYYTPTHWRAKPSTPGGET